MEQNVQHVFIIGAKGRSNIVDFDEVGKLDRQYIDDWSIGLDLRIILMTLREMITGSGAE